MATGILGLGSSGADVLSTENLNSFKEIEYDAYITPIEDDIEEADAESEALTTIQEAINDLLATIEDFDLYTTGTNIFDQFSASTSGDSVVFDSVDNTQLETGIRTVNVTYVAQKDVYQTEKFSDTSSTVGLGTLTIQVGSGTEYSFDTDSLTYEQLKDNIESTIIGIDASIEQVSDSEYRLVLKSEETGDSNTLTFTGAAATSLGIDDASDTTHHIQTAQNMNVTIGGVNYDVSSDTVTTADGLIVTGIETGSSTISITRDTSAVEEYLDAFVLAYNNLLDTIDEYTVDNDDSPISDRSTLTSIMSTIKSTLMDSYGSDDSLNIFSMGFEFDIDGHLSLDADELSTALNKNFDDVKRLFVGVAEDEGIGTILAEYVDDLDGYNGLMSLYQEDLDERKEDLETQLEEEKEELDDKYSKLAERWAAYTAIITSMENSFAGLKAMIEGVGEDD